MLDCNGGRPAVLSTWLSSCRSLTTMLVIAGAVSVLAAAPFQVPTFRSSVDLVVVDVTVMDDTGAPVTTLRSSDFHVIAGGRSRTVVSSEYIRTGGLRPMADPFNGLGIRSAASNQVPVGQRSFLVVVDSTSVRAVGAHFVFDRIATFVDGLGPYDRVGLVVLPGGGPRVDLTLDHSRVSEAIRKVVGGSHQGETSLMTPGEASLIARGDRMAAGGYLGRLGATQCPTVEYRLGSSRAGAPSPPPADMRQCMKQANLALERYLAEARAVLQSLSVLASAMAPIGGPKALIVISNGITVGPQNGSDLRAFASAAEAARVALYALQPAISLMEASSGGGPTAEGRVLDRQIGLDGLASVAHAARGTAFEVVGTADEALRQIDRETSGYYILGFERDAQDARDRPMRVDVRVAHDGYTVRARENVTPAPDGSAVPWAGREPREALGQLLRWPLPVRDFPVYADVFLPAHDYVTPALAVILAAEFGVAEELRGIGYEVLDSAGSVVQDGFEPKPQTRSHLESRRYVKTLTLPGGSYTLKLAAISPRGGASVELRFVVKDSPVGVFNVGDMFFCDDVAGSLMPTPRVRRTFTAIVDVSSRSTAEVEGAVGLITVVDERGRVVMKGESPLSSATNGSRYSVVANVNMEHLPAGDYVMRVQLVRGSAVLADRSRRFSRE